MDVTPRWIDAIVVPVLSILFALFLTGLVLLYIGLDPIDALILMLSGSLGSTYGWGYTLYYTTNFIFTGLCAALSFQVRLFNIGGEGQATLGGLGVALVCLALPWPHWLVALPAAILGAALFGAAAILIPAFLLAKRGNNIIITTIMFNYIVAALMVYMLVQVLKPAGEMEPATARFPPGTALPKLSDVFALVGIPFSSGSPANISFFVAVFACVAVWVLLWRTRFGYEMRAFGHSEKAAAYAGVSQTRVILVSLLISGALAGCMALNSVMASGRLVLNAVENAGYIGLAVALMGRSHPFGVLLAALLFGILYQSGGELALWANVPRELILVIQGLVVLFTGALDNMLRLPVIWLYRRLRRARG